MMTASGTNLLLCATVVLVIAVTGEFFLLKMKMEKAVIIFIWLRLLWILMMGLDFTESFLGESGEKVKKSYKRGKFSFFIRYLYLVTFKKILKFCKIAKIDLMDHGSI